MSDTFFPTLSVRSPSAFTDQSFNHFHSYEKLTPTSPPRHLTTASPLRGTGLPNADAPAPYVRKPDSEIVRGPQSHFYARHESELSTRHINSNVKGPETSAQNNTPSFINRSPDVFTRSNTPLGSISADTSGLSALLTQAREELKDVRRRHEEEKAVLIRQLSSARALNEKNLIQIKPELENFRLQLAHHKGQLEDAQKENEELRRQLKLKESTSAMPPQYSSDRTQYPSVYEELEQLKREYENLKRENDEKGVQLTWSTEMAAQYYSTRVELEQLKLKFESGKPERVPLPISSVSPIEQQKRYPEKSDDVALTPRHLAEAKPMNDVATPSHSEAKGKLLDNTTEREFNQPQVLEKENTQFEDSNIRSPATARLWAEVEQLQKDLHELRSQDLW